MLYEIEKQQILKRLKEDFLEEVETNLRYLRMSKSLGK